jgi:hypothetical protein
MSTVRMYADECNVTFEACFFSIQGGGDGILFQPGEIIEQVVPKFNEQTGEAIAQFGGRQEQILYTSVGNPVANASDPSAGTLAGFKTGTHPLILIWTVDVDQNAPGGMVDVLLGLQSYDDTAQNISTGGATHPCNIFGGTAKTIPAKNGKVGGPGSCGSNFLNTGPETYSFTVEAPQHPSTPNSLAAFDTNKSCFLDDPEFFAMIDGWVGNQIGDTLFFAGVDAWVGQTNICNTPTAASALLQRVELQSSGLGTTTFTVTGQSIESMSVQVFSLNGSLVFSQETAGTHLSWNQTMTTGAPLANGTYLYVVKAKDALGASLTSEVRKLVIVR